ncbi:MAG: hypothetical protein CSA55_05975 [Ilumatobacter coccineus]|uniref:Uncharacterized protein n=1 Tax=Ilumatobacter coccineus TaxID=467094 RepID=A0A2G6K6Q9_9ACTN|nr:MAG: hypothetical protein CSA55_05975 [Ilumatobacter coccineus]
MRDVLLPSLRFNGWTMDWYAGMPAYNFYMVLPALVVVAVDVILPYGVALKLVSVLGVLTIPASAWAFGRLSQLRYPIPQLMAFAGLVFVLDDGVAFEIYGGNLKSTMAGEFSFSIALSLAILALGVLAAGLRTGKYRVWAAVLIAAAGLSHGIVMIFVALAAVVISLAWLDRQRIRYIITVGVTSVLLMMWWLGPFLMNHASMTDMKYGPRPGGSFDGHPDSYWFMFFPLTAPLNWIVTGLAIVGVASVVLRRHRTGIALSVLGILLVPADFAARHSLPVIGLLWNPRVLPFFYLVRYLLMAIGIAELGSLAVNAVRNQKVLADIGTKANTAIAVVGAVGILAVLGFFYQELPFGSYRSVTSGGETHTVYGWGPINASITNKDAQGDGWSRYNFMGYEGRNEYYTEYYNVVQTMATLGSDQAHGCGRAMWENSGDNGTYGTTMSLMLLPFWTDGCIGSMEGLFFEGAGTTPYHFLTTAAMSKSSSNPVRELRYVNNDAEIGVRHLHDLGVRYVMLRTPEAQTAADSRSELDEVASSGPWKIYEVADTALVTGLDVQPVVVNPRPGDQRERRLETGTSWFQQPEDWAAMPADNGPDTWQHIDVMVDLDRQLVAGEPGGPRVDIVVPAETIQPVDLPKVEITDLVIEQQSLSFSVDQVGVPVLVRVSYFPNWKASGADGPYRIGPNMMVVVPTDRQVELHYGRSGVDLISIVLTLIGIGLCIWWRREGDLDLDSSARDDDPGSDGDDDPSSPVALSTDDDER